MKTFDTGAETVELPGISHRLPWAVVIIVAPLMVAMGITLFALGLGKARRIGMKADRSEGQEPSLPIPLIAEVGQTWASAPVSGLIEFAAVAFPGAAMVWLAAEQPSLAVLGAGWALVATLGAVVQLVMFRRAWRDPGETPENLPRQAAPSASGEG